VSSLLTRFDASTPPERFPSPFEELGPHPVARRAAERLKAELAQGWIAPGVPASILEGAEGGKMFGVLVVREGDGHFAFLRAFSGMLVGRWQLAGFVPPMFDEAERTSIEVPGEARVKALVGEAAAFEQSSERQPLLAAREAMERKHAAALEELRERHQANKQRRREARVGLQDASALHVLEQASRADKAERRRLEETHEAERRGVLERLEAIERQRAAMELQRQTYCRDLMQQLHDTYRVPNARGEERRLRALYTGEPPSGAGDCAAPKLLAYALRHGLQPVALAEFWWGAPPRTGGRLSGEFYPACRDKCGPLLPFMMEGLDVAPPRLFVPPSRADHGLEILFEDEWIVVIDKPAGLLSVPAKDEAITDSVQARLRSRHPQALLAHRLDLDTSGLIVAAKDLDSYAALQAQFAGREVEKRYVAWIDGDVAADRGVIDFPMRVDLNDRPRQIHDPVHGKPALTEWAVLERAGERTRVAFFPRTGRTHQLRVHAAHPLGLGRPIVGDRLYGREDVRLMLHAEALAFRHPHTGERVAWERAAPF
jgi:tRNA pseudouridine32 synthase/23S rRNA pseudouridine746 synthase